MTPSTRPITASILLHSDSPFRSNRCSQRPLWYIWSEGPRTHPKKDLTVVGYSLALLYTKNPGGNPDTVDEFYDRLYDALSLRRAIRFSIFFCIGAAYLVLTAYSFVPLYRLTTTGDSLVPGILLLTQSIFLVQGVIMTRFANVLPPEEAEWVRVPEFRRHKEVFSQEEYENNEFRDPPLILDDLNNRITDLGSSPSTESSSNSEDAE